MPLTKLVQDLRILGMSERTSEAIETRLRNENRRAILGGIERVRYYFGGEWGEYYFAITIPIETISPKPFFLDRIS